MALRSSDKELSEKVTACFLRNFLVFLTAFLRTLFLEGVGVLADFLEIFGEDLDAFLAGVDDGLAGFLVAREEARERGAEQDMQVVGFHVRPSVWDPSSPDGGGSLLAGRAKIDRCPARRIFQGTFDLCRNGAKMLS